jgi:hypothetical protein
MASSEEIWFNLSHEPLKPLVDPYIAVGDMSTTTELYNANTWGKVFTPVGQTRILSTIGLDAGNRLLNHISDTPEYRQVDKDMLAKPTKQIISEGFSHDPYRNSKRKNEIDRAGFFWR